MFHPSEADGDVDMQREGSRDQDKKSFLSDVVFFLSRIFSFLKKSLQTLRDDTQLKISSSFDKYWNI